ncbi:MAG: DMT family transporter [Microbacteriaceae bacterium]|nr:MAG: DMT family transporter [Microbacteriaceae bacterium]
MTHEHALRPFVTSLAVVSSVVMGGFMAAQSRINGELAHELDDGILAALISFGVGTLAAALALVVWRPGRRGLGLIRDAVRDGRTSPWFLIGGTAGALMVTSQGLTTPVVGVALFTVAIVGGQTVGSLLLDRRGLGTMAPKPLTSARLVGALLAVVAVVWGVSGRLSGDAPWWLLVLPFVAGIATTWQQAANGQLRGAAGSALSATFVSFVAGTLALAVAAVVDLAISGPPASFSAGPWLYTGGLLGIVFIAGAAVIVPLVGVLLYTLATIAGQLVVAVFLDVLFPVGSAHVDAATLGGAVLAIVAVAIASFRRPGHRTA